MTTTTEELLNAQDRCDRCGGRAYQLVTLHSGSSLMFCNHHGTEHADKLAEIDVKVYKQPVD